MSQIKALQIAKEHGLHLVVKSVKEKKGHGGETLLSGKVYFKNKPFATYSDLDWGHPDFADVSVSNQEIYNDILEKIKALPKYYEPAIQQDVEPTFISIARESCIVNLIEKKAKRLKPVSYFDTKTGEIVTFSKSGGHTTQSIQDYIETLKDIVPFYKLDDEKVTEYFLKQHNLI